MATLATSNDSLQLLTASSASVDYTVVFADSAGDPQAGSQTADGNVAAATTTTLVASPPGRVSRTVKSVMLRNKSASASQTVTLLKNVNGTAYSITPAITLFAGESMIYKGNDSLEVYTATGRKKLANGAYLPPQLMTNPAFQTNDITSTLTVGPGWCVASYMGRAPRNLDWATVRLRVTTACSVGPGEWAQVALAKGDINVGGNPTFTVVGFTSAEGILNSTGLKSVIVSVGAQYAINEGDNIWVLAGCSTGTGGISNKFRAGLADDVQGGSFALVSSEPSAILGQPTTGVILGAAVSAPWFELVT